MQFVLWHKKFSLLHIKRSFSSNLVFGYGFRNHPPIFTENRISTWFFIHFIIFELRKEIIHTLCVFHVFCCWQVEQQYIIFPLSFFLVLKISNNDFLIEKNEHILIYSRKSTQVMMSKFRNFFTYFYIAMNNIEKTFTACLHFYMTRILRWRDEENNLLLNIKIEFGKIKVWNL
jgi:hypothetical protein